MTERPLETRQLDSLRDWLSESSWTIEEAACLLAGVLPPERMGDSSDFGGWLPGLEASLPGCEAWQPGLEAWRQIVSARIAHVDAVLRQQGAMKGASPQDFLLLGARHKIIPPWGEMLLDSRFHAVALPLKARSRLREAVGLSKETNRRANASFAARADNWAEAVFRAEELLGKGMTAADIANVLPDEGFWRSPSNAEPYSVAAIRGWRREFKGDPDKGIPARTASEKTADFREWRDRVNR